MDVSSPTLLTSCETFVDPVEAADRAEELAKKTAGHSEWVGMRDHLLADGSDSVVFLETSRHTVMLLSKEVSLPLLPSFDLGASFAELAKALLEPTLGIVSESIDSKPLPLAVTAHSCAPVAPVPAAVPVSNYHDDDPELPFSWDLSGKPVCLKDVTDPYSVENPLDLTDVKQWALVTARVKKSPGFRFPTSQGTLTQTLALKELQDKTMLGEELVNAQIATLADILDCEIRNSDF